MYIIRHKEAGFTLMEILMAMMVFILGSVSILALFVSSISNHKDALDNESVALLVESIISDLTLIKGKPLHSINNQQKKNFPDFMYDVHFRSLGYESVFVEIKIKYKRNGKQREQKFTTVLSETRK